MAALRTCAPCVRLCPTLMGQQDGIRARNQDFSRYEGVAKQQSYHLAETPDDEQFDDEFVVRTCDMRAPTFVQDLGDALREIGFAILDGHGVDPALYADAERRIDDIFTRLSLEEKMRFRAQRYGSVNQGYFPIKETSNMHPDLVEGWVFCRRAFDLGDDPSAPPPLEEFWPRPEAHRVFREMCLAPERLVLPRL